MQSSPPPPMPMVQKPETSGLAIASFICGLLGFVTAGLTGIAAVITGHLALSAINKSGGMVGGRGLSITGLITGYLTILILPIAILAGLAAPVILKQRKAADRTEVMNDMRQISLPLFEFDAEYGSYPSDQLAGEHSQLSGLTGEKVLKQLEATGLVDDIERTMAVRRPEPGDHWLYFPGRTSSADPDLPVLISPLVGDKHAVLRLDGSVKAIDPAELSSFNLSAAVRIGAPKKTK